MQKSGSRLGQNDKANTHHSLSDNTSQVPEESKMSSLEHVSPFDFVNFLPWVCLEWGVSDGISVVRVAPEGAMRMGHKRTGARKSHAPDPSQAKQIEETYEESPKKFDSQTLYLQPFCIFNENTVTVRAHYDNKDCLVEISIIGCPVKLPTKIIRALSLCIPFHSVLTKLTVRRGGLTHSVLLEISKLLRHSNITDICLDDSYLPQGNYHVLLQETTHLSYLSLNRCKINDEICKKIAMKLIFGNPAANSLRILELASNDITDEGVKFLGTMLRMNRGLMHLNLADNNFSDDGAIGLMNSLMEFRLTDDEVLETKRRKIRYLENKHAVYKKCLVELLLQQKIEGNLSKSTIITTTGTLSKISAHSKSRIKIAKKHKKNLAPSINPEEFAENLAKGVVGDFIDPYCPMHVEKRQGCYYAKGNFVLCSLNLAYNNLHYPFLQKIDEIVLYQQQVVKLPPAQGLIRIVLEGNNLPETCEELDRIDTILRAKLPKSPTPNRRRQSSAVSKRSRSRSERQVLKR